MTFRDRNEAGEKLGAKLAELALTDPIVLAIPRGGVVVGAAIATKLGAELDVVLSRKLRSPEQPELALGAVAEDGRIILDPRRGDDPALRRSMEHEAQSELEEIKRRVELFRGGRGAAPVTGRSVIVVDDGIATGSTALAAIATVRAAGPKETILATPVMPAEHLPVMTRICERVVSLLLPEDLWAIGQFYDDFTQVPDAEVVRLLEENRRTRRGGAT
jgi:predicted phosphoribosyltransferase